MKLSNISISNNTVSSNIMKAHVRSHVRTSKTGKLSQVKNYENKKTSKLDSDEVFKIRTDYEKDKISIDEAIKKMKQGGISDNDFEMKMLMESKKSKEYSNKQKKDLDNLEKRAKERASISLKNIDELPKFLRSTVEFTIDIKKDDFMKIGSASFQTKKSSLYHLYNKLNMHLKGVKEIKSIPKDHKIKKENGIRYFSPHFQILIQTGKYKSDPYTFQVFAMEKNK